MKVYIWGTGIYAQTLINECKIEICGYIETIKSKEIFNNKEVYEPAYFVDHKYDCIIVANSYTKEIYKICKDLNLDMAKIVFLNYNYEIGDLNKNYDLISSVLSKSYAEKMCTSFDEFKEKHIIIPKAHTFDDSPIINSDTIGLNYTNIDYVRIKTFEMIVRELKKYKVAGEMAEVGVFRGEFAQFINRAFENKKLYLFDSFESFRENEAESEKNQGYCNDGFIEIFKSTSIESVISKMKYPQNVIIKQGFFPESLDGLDTDFAFVSLDVDFEESTLDGLRYFYPRLSEGGYIFIHDYNYCDDLNLKGVECAVERYEIEIGKRLNKVPICDQGGTLIITK